MTKETGFLKQLCNEVKVKGTWDKGELERMILRKLEAAKAVEDRQKVKTIEIYDFFSYKIMEIPHPCVIFKIEGEKAWGIVASTAEGAVHNVDKIINSRHLERGWWTNTVVCSPVEKCLKHWLGIFDNPEEVKRAVGLLNEYYKKLLDNAG